MPLPPMIRRAAVHLLLSALERGPLARWLDGGDDCPRCRRMATALRVEAEAREAVERAGCGEHVA